MKHFFTFLFAFVLLGAANAQWSTDPTDSYRMMVGGSAQHTALTSDGRIYVAWGSPVLRLNLFNPDGTVAAEWPANGLRVLPPNTDEASWFGHYGLTVAPDNSVIVGYCDSRYGAKPNNGDNQIFQPFAYRISDKAKSLWDPKGIMLQDTREISPYNKAMDPQIAMTNDGYVLASWNYFPASQVEKVIKSSQGQDSTIMVWVEFPVAKIMMLDLETGEHLWEGPINIDDSYFPHIVPSGKSDFIVAYKRSATATLYANKYNGVTGDLIWSKQLGSAPIADGNDFMMAPDGQNGAIITWLGIGASNYAMTQRVDANGGLTMGAYGTPATNDGIATKQSSIKMSVDQKNQIVYVQWTNTILSEYRSFSIQAIDFNGEYLFSNKGIKLSPDPQDADDKFSYEGSGIASTGDGVISFYSGESKNEKVEGLKAVYISQSGEIQWKNQVTTKKATGIATPFFNNQAVVLWGGLYGQNINKDGSLGYKTSGIDQTFVAKNYTINSSNNEVKIELDTQAPSLVCIDLYNMTGQKVATIANQTVDTGTFEFNWNSSNLSKGVYLLSISVNAEKQTVKIIL